MRWRTWLRILQVLVTVGLITLLLRAVDWAGFWGLAARVRWGMVALCGVVLLSSHLVNVLRWRFLLQRQGVGFGILLAVYGAGLFCNNILPTGIGGDGLRAAMLSRRVPGARALLSVILDRGLGLLALTVLLGPGLWFGLPAGLEVGWGRFLAIGGRPWLGPALSLATAALVLIGLVAWYRVPRVRLWMRDLRARWVTSLQELRWSPGRWAGLVAGGYGLSVVSQLCLLANIWLALQALRIQAPVGSAIWLLIIGSVALLLPVTINGLGLQEGLYVVLLAAYGVPQPAALSVALLLRLQMVFSGLLGGLLSLWRGPSGRGEKEEGP